MSDRCTESASQRWGDLRRGPVWAEGQLGCILGVLGVSVAGERLVWQDQRVGEGREQDRPDCWILHRTWLFFKTGS